MTRQRQRRLGGWFGCTLLLGGCGGGMPLGDVTRLSLPIKRAPVDHPLAQPAQYRVTVRAPGVADLVATFDGAATSGELTEVPAGTGREIVVEAINAAEQLVQQGGRTDVEIVGGATTEIPIELAIVPIFTNLTDGQSVVATRFVPEVLADPASSITVMEQRLDAVAPAVAAPLFDLASGSAELTVDPSGLVQVRPARLPAGPYRFEVQDRATGLRSMVTIRLVDRAVRAAPLVAAGSVRPTTVGRVMRGSLVVPTE